MPKYIILKNSAGGELDRKEVEPDETPADALLSWLLVDGPELDAGDTIEIVET